MTAYERREFLSKPVTFMADSGGFRRFQAQRPVGKGRGSCCGSIGSGLAAWGGRWRRLWRREVSAVGGSRPWGGWVCATGEREDEGPGCYTSPYGLGPCSCQATKWAKMDARQI
ncbi:unnamed protein product [Prunus armeniaca]